MFSLQYRGFSARSHRRFQVGLVRHSSQPAVAIVGIAIFASLTSAGCSVTRDGPEFTFRAHMRQIEDALDTVFGAEVPTLGGAGWKEWFARTNERVMSGTQLDQAYQLGIREWPVVGRNEIEYIYECSDHATKSLIEMHMIFGRNSAVIILCGRMEKEGERRIVVGNAVLYIVEKSAGVTAKTKVSL